MNLLIVIAIGYITAFAINILLFRLNIGRLGGWLAMFADPRHGRMLNIVALIVVYFPPIVYLIFLCQLCGLVQKNLKK